jgi:hypothetical protein
MEKNATNITFSISVTVTNNNSIPINGVTLLDESPISKVTIAKKLSSFGRSCGEKEIIPPSLAPGQFYP